MNLSNAEKLSSRLFNEAIDSYYRIDLKRNFISGLHTPLFMTIAGLFICALLAIGAMLHEENDASWVLMLLLFIICLYRLLSPINVIIHAQASIAGNIDAFDRLEKFYKESTNAQQMNGIIEAKKLTKKIEFKNISYSYPNSDQPALENLSFTIPARKMVALVGPSGSGKSTIVGLVTRLFDPQSGKIVIDDTELTDFELGSWRNRIGVVTQETYLFNDTISNNILFGRDNVSFEEIQKSGAVIFDVNNL